ncbi:MAG: type II secretion system protein [Planctomycetota bacterium]|nr:type II secretion system protein [Planctomycetota bacterium]
MTQTAKDADRPGTTCDLPRRPSQRGFTMFEIIVVTSLIALALASIGPLFTSNTNLVEDSRALQRAEAAHRRNMAAVARVLRGVDIQTLSGFDSLGTTTQPQFSRVTGADLDDLTYAGHEQLRWIEAPIAVDGVKNPGAVYLEQAGQRTLVADRVPAGGFRVRQEGQSLVIELRTYWTTSAGRSVSTASESVISVRN